MNHKVRVSIGVPVYNGEAFLEETLESLLAQTFEDFELIISDNASTDGTADIARRVATRDSRVRYHRRRQNQGMAVNYNGLVEMASAELFKWATADDVCRPQFLEQCVAALDETPDGVLAYPRTQFIAESGRPIALEDPGFPLNWPRAVDRWRYVVGAGHWVNAILGVVPRAALLRTSLMPSFPGGDYVLLGELCLLGRFVEVPETLFLRRLHPESSSQMGSDERRWLEFMTGQSRGVALPEWRRVRGHLKTVIRSELRWREKLELLSVLGRQARHRRAALWHEAVHAVRTIRRWAPWP